MPSVDERPTSKIDFPGMQKTHRSLPLFSSNFIHFRFHVGSKPTKKFIFFCTWHAIRTCGIWKVDPLFNIFLCVLPPAGEKLCSSSLVIRRCFVRFKHGLWLQQNKRLSKIAISWRGFSMQDEIIVRRYNNCMCTGARAICRKNMEGIFFSLQWLL